MVWIPICATLARPSAAKKTAAVRMACNLGMRGANPCILLIVRPADMGGLTAWFAPGARVSAERGAGEHEGMLRIRPGGDIVLSKTPGVAAGRGSVVLRLGALPSWTPTVQKPAPVEYDWGDDWLIVTLPAWARALRSATPDIAEAPTQSAKPADRKFKIGARDGFADRHVPNGGLPGGGLR